MGVQASLQDLQTSKQTPAGRAAVAAVNPWQPPGSTPSHPPDLGAASHCDYQNSTSQWPFEAILEVADSSLPGELVTSSRPPFCHPQVWCLGVQQLAGCKWCRWTPGVILGHCHPPNCTVWHPIWAGVEMADSWGCEDHLDGESAFMHSVGVGPRVGTHRA